MSEPLIRQGGISGRWYVITRYSQKGDQITASRKYDVTDQVETIRREAVEQAFSVERLARAMFPAGVDVGSYDNEDVLRGHRLLAAAILAQLRRES